MGIINVTPDSFSDGGEYNTPNLAINRAVELIQDGADIIDIGGESTRPGSQAVDEQEEMRRVLPVVEMLAKKLDTIICVDTTKAAVAKAALEAGAHIINDINGLHGASRGIANYAARYKAGLIIGHNSKSGTYPSGIMPEIVNYLKQGVKLALDSGVETENIVIDPGIGFGKTYEQSLEVLSCLEQLKEIELPVMLGVSRKSVIGVVLGLPVKERAIGTIAANVVGITKGVDFVRVHDVKEHVQACRMADAMFRTKG